MSGFLAFFGLGPADPVRLAEPPAIVREVRHERAALDPIPQHTPPDLLAEMGAAYAGAFAVTGDERRAMLAALTCLRWADLRDPAVSGPHGRRISAKAQRRVRRTLDAVLIEAQFGGGP